MSSVCMVLLRQWSEDGFLFFTTIITAVKAMENCWQLAQAAFCMHWKSLRKQIRVTGLGLTKASAMQSDAYFGNRVRLRRWHAICAYGVVNQWSRRLYLLHQL